MLGEVGHDGKVLAGGQSLIPILNMRLASPAHLVDINRVVGVDTVEVTADAVRVGALVRHAGLERSPEAYAALPLLRQALVNVAHPAIRNRGTTVGSIAHADAAGEMPAILALTDGVVEVAGPSGAREIAWRDFFLGALETSLAADELAVAVRFGRLSAGTVTAFTEASRRHGDYAMAGVGVAVEVLDGWSAGPGPRSSPSPTCPRSSTSPLPSGVSSPGRPRGTPASTSRPRRCAPTSSPRATSTRAPTTGACSSPS